MAKNKSPQAAGKDFEEDVRLALKGITNHHKAMFHRLYDTRSAGTYLPDQPADFFFMFCGNFYLIECKSSAKYRTLSSALSSVMEVKQAALPRMWVRAGAASLILFLDQEGQEVEIWDGSLVHEIRVAPGKRLPADGFIRRVPKVAIEAHLLIHFRGEDTL